MKRLFFPVLLLLLLGGAVVYGVSHHALAPSGSTFSTTTPTALEALPPPPYVPRTPPAGWHEYHNLTYHFSLFYPDGLLVKEYKEKGTALTVTFENAAETQGFQAYVMPYGGTELTPDLLARAGQRNATGTTPITIDGKDALVFFGTDPALGVTREAWFIHHGFLFEVTAPKADDALLSQVMATWQLF